MKHFVSLGAEDRMILKRLTPLILFLVRCHCNPYQSHSLPKQDNKISHENELPVWQSSDEHLIDTLINRLMKDPEFLGLDPAIINRLTEPLRHLRSSKSSNELPRNPFDSVTRPETGVGLLPGFIQAFQRISSSFFEQIIQSSNRILVPVGVVSNSTSPEQKLGQQQPSSTSSSSNNNAATSIGANSIGIGEGDIPHRPVSANGKPTGVEPPRPEKEPDVSSIGKVPASIVNQTASIASQGSKH